MSVDNPQQRADDSNLAVLCQRFNDFMVNSEKHYEEEKEERKRVANTLELTTQNFSKEIKELTEKYLTLPCSSRKQLWDAKMETIEKDSKNQWIIIGALWTTIGACAYSIFEAWIKLWNGGK